MKDRLAGFAANIVDLCREVRRDPAGRDLADQLSAAAGSMHANYRAACRARSHKEFTAKIGIGLEEADEAAGWLDVAVRAKLISPLDTTTLITEAKELLSILAKSHRTAKRNDERMRRPTINGR